MKKLTNIIIEAGIVTAGVGFVAFMTLRSCDCDPSKKNTEEILDYAIKTNTQLFYTYSDLTAGLVEDQEDYYWSKKGVKWKMRNHPFESDCLVVKKEYDNWGYARTKIKETDAKNCEGIKRKSQCQTKRWLGWIDYESCDNVSDVYRTKE